MIKPQLVNLTLFCMYNAPIFLKYAVNTIELK